MVPRKSRLILGPSYYNDVINRCSLEAMYLSLYHWDSIGTMGQGEYIIYTNTSKV